MNLVRLQCALQHVMLVTLIKRSSCCENGSRLQATSVVSFLVG